MIENKGLLNVKPLCEAGFYVMQCTQIAMGKKPDKRSFEEYWEDMRIELIKKGEIKEGGKTHG